MRERLLLDGKTGGFLDQQENHARAAEYVPARSTEFTALDAFAYHGGFALALARAGARTRPGDVLLRLVDVDRPAAMRPGLTRFDPWFPGASPFRVQGPKAARVLLEALRGYATPMLPNVHVFIEDNEAMAKLLQKAGAEVRSQMYQMRGDLAELPARG